MTTQSEVEQVYINNLRVDTVHCLANCILDVGPFRLSLSPYEIGEIRRCPT